MADGSQWTLDTLRIYLEALIAALSRQLDERQHAQEQATRAALVAAEKRLDAMSEFRRQLTDQTAEFITRPEADAAHSRFGASIAELWIANRLCMPRTEYESAHQRLIEQIAEMSQRLDRAEGRAAGMSAGWGYLIAIIAAVGAIVSIYVAINRL